MKKPALIWISILLLSTGKPAVSQEIKPDIQKLAVSLQTGLTKGVKMDTAISGAQVYHPLIKKFPSWSEMGNMGLPAIPNRYAGLGSSIVPEFIKPYLNYLEDQDHIQYYNTKTPYSQINYNSGGTKDKNGQNLGFLYSRNLGREINITGLFDFISSTGHYSNQATIESTLGLKIVIEKERYRHYTNLERIQFKLQENGGVAEDNDALSASRIDASLVKVNLDKASTITSIIRLRGWQSMDLLAPPKPDSTDSTAVQRIPNPKRPVLIHRYNYTSTKRIYNDDPEAGGFYENIFIDSASTLDSMQYYGFVNELNARFNREIGDSTSWMLEAGIKHELHHFYSHENSVWKQRLGAAGLTSLERHKYYLRAQGVFHFAGYGAGDFSVDLQAGLVNPGKYGGPALQVSTKALSADMFVQNLMSNHFQWTNNFQRQKEQRVGLSWEIPKWRLSFEVNSFLISDWIYFNDLAKPAQREDAAFLASAGLKKSFQAGPFRSQNSVFLNYTTAAEIPLPMIVAATSTFMHHDIHFPKTNGLLQLEYGFDIRYTSAYNGYAYMPATGVFYLQNHRILGNYPFVDLFLIMKVKRTRFFVKWDHVNAGFTGDNIFPVLHYPVKQRYLKYGVFWYFYD